ncbi:MAG: hypothetical protein KAT75_04400 [Dehalococcoidia bacterium]|nr:hypothetical protein [Dehalococcoidia bacterium]
MSFEWRIFFTDSSFDPWNPKQEEARELKEWLARERVQKGRRDYYFDLQDFGVGLKERWTGKSEAGNPPYLELKVRERQEGEVEWWDKCIRKRIEEPIDERQGLDVEVVRSHLRVELENPGPKTGKFITKIEEILVRLEEGLPTRIKVSKERRQARILLSGYTGMWHIVVDEGYYRDLVQVEQTELEISRGADSSRFRCRTVCVEGKELALVERFRDAFILRGNGLVAGYPEFLADIRRP